MPNAAPAHRARLAKAMEDRLEELGLRWQDVSAATGVSVRALQLARDPDREGTPSKTTLEGIDKGLRWEPGSARQLLASGRDPVPLPDDQAGRRTAAPLRPAEALAVPADLEQAIDAGLLAAMIRARLEEFGGRVPDGGELLEDGDPLGVGRVAAAGLAAAWDTGVAAGLDPERAAAATARAWVRRLEARQRSAGGGRNAGGA